MKRTVLISVVSAFMLVLLMAFSACGSTQPEDVLEREPATAFAAAIADMRQARQAASVLGAFAGSPAAEILLGNGWQQSFIQYDNPQQVILQLMYPVPVGPGDTPTRSQFTVMLDSLTFNGEAVSEAMYLRPGLDVTVYNHEDFHYIEGGISLLGLPFQVVNIGVDGHEVSVQVPLLYNRYFTVDLDTILRDVFGDALEEAVMEDQDFYLPLEVIDFEWFVQHRQLQRARQQAIVDAFSYTIDMKTIFMDVVEALLTEVPIWIEDEEHVLIIPAQQATEALAHMWDSLFEMVMAVDFSTINGDFESEMAELLYYMRIELDMVYFAQDVRISYVLENNVLLAVEIEAVLASDGEDLRILIAYTNNSGDHVGDVTWVVELEGFHYGSPIAMGFEYTSRREDNHFYTRHEYSLENEHGANSFYMFAQGSTGYGEDFFTFDFERLGFGIEGSGFDFELVLGAFFRHEAVDIAVLPSIDPADQFFVMAACDEELDRVWQQIEDNIDTLTGLFSFLGLVD